MSNLKEQAKTTIKTSAGEYTAYDLSTLSQFGNIDTLPYSIKVLLEACLRNLDNKVVFDEHIAALAGYKGKSVGEQEIPFKPGRVVLQDFTGVPAVVDLAALRSAMHRLGGDVQKVNPLTRVDLVIDHSVQVDAFGNAGAIQINKEFEFERNRERYEFLKWGQESFNNFAVVPPETGIVHQVNLEYLASVVLEHEGTVYPDSLVGTDSHTTMINGLGVLGWGAGGIEAEAAMLGQPIYMLIPEVVGFKLTGQLREGATATDLVLTVTQMLRRHGVVSKFVEFHGPGLSHLTLSDRATIANMAPEYGATMGFFPVDEKSLDYMRLTGRDEALIELVEKYNKLNGLWRNDDYPIEYTSELTLDLGEVQPSLAGPKRPQDRILLSDMKGAFGLHLKTEFKRDVPTSAPTEYKGHSFDLKDGDVVIAAITSCTNTSNPAVMLAAGLVAKKASALGLKAKPWVKTSLAPGSRVVTDYLDKSGLTEHLEATGFYTVGYGCTTCIGNSGPLPAEVAKSIEENELVVASVLSGNRNFEGRISPHTQVNYLASPPLVVAYALAGSVNIDIFKDPIAKGSNGQDVYLKDIWPSNAEVAQEMSTAVTREQFVNRYSAVFEGPKEWREIPTAKDAVYGWPPHSTYVQEPPFFINMPKDARPIQAIQGARVLLKLGDSVTTDHISPAGAIPKGSPAAQYLDKHGVEPRMYNSFGSRRGNDRVMTRGTFGNIRIRNQMAPGTEGGFTTYLGPDHTPDGPFTWLSYDSDVDPQSGETCYVYDAAVKYQKHQIPLVVLAGIDYGMGSSRDWAAKGAFLLGIRAVIAKSYERIHRSNLIGMGVLPLEFQAGQSAESLGLSGQETFDIAITDAVQPLQEIEVKATAPDGSVKTFTTLCRIDTPVEVDYYRHGGILHYVLRRMAE